MAENFIPEDYMPESQFGKVKYGHMQMAGQNPEFMQNQEFMMPCIPQETVIRNVKLARAYVPFQRMCTILQPLESLVKGTVFPELYSPYWMGEKHGKMSVQ